MRVGFFASLVDKIQHAYGWDDETVFNLTLRRAVQMKEAIEQRLEFGAWEELRITEWQTQSLAAMIVNTAQVDQKARTELMGLVNELTLSGAPSQKKQTTTHQKTYRTVDGDIIPASELRNYRYDEIDHSEEEAANMEAARRQNAGKNLMSLGLA